MDELPEGGRQQTTAGQRLSAGSTGQEQHLYARWLDRGMRAGLLMAVGGWCLSWWPVAQGQDPGALLQSLRQPARGLAASLGPSLAGMGLGPAVGLAGVALLAACALPALLGLLPMARRQQDRVLIGLALGQALVIALGIASTALR